MARKRKPIPLQTSLCHLVAIRAGALVTELSSATSFITPKILTTRTYSHPNLQRSYLWFFFAGHPFRVLRSDVTVLETLPLVVGMPSEWKWWLAREWNLLPRRQKDIVWKKARGGKRGAGKKRKPHSRRREGPMP